MKINVEFSVDEESLRRTLKKIEPKLKDGAEDGLDEVLQTGQAAARERIMERRNPFTSPHLKDRGSFYTNTIEEDNKIRGTILNVLDYAAYVDKGVSGTQNPRDTPFAYTDSKPPVQKLVPWVQKHLNAWDIGSDSDPFDGSDDGGSSPEETRDDGSEFYNDLDAYVLPGGYEKKRLTDADQFARGVDVQFATNSSGDTYSGTVRRTQGEGIGGGEVEFTSPVFTEPKIINPSDSDYDFVGRQKDKSFWEVESGDEVIIEVFDSDGLQKEEKYGIIKEVQGTGDQKIVLFDNLFNDRIHSIEISESQYIGTRKENSNRWGDDVDYSETIDSLPSDFVSPEFNTRPDNRVEKELFSLFGEFIDYENPDLPIKDPDGNTWLAETSVESSTFTLDAGRDINGNKIEFSFSTPQELYDSDWEILGIPKRRKDFYQLSENDEIIVDVREYSGADYFEKTTGKEQLIRAKIENVITRDNGSREILFRPSGSVATEKTVRRVTIPNFEGTRQSLSGVWDAKSAAPGKKITYEKFGDVETGYYIPSTGDDREKQYQIDSFKVFNQDLQEKRLVDGSNVRKVEDIENFGSISEPTQSEIENNIPSDFTQIDIKYSHNLVEEKDYIVYLNREDTFLEATYETEGVLTAQLRPVADGDNRPLELGGRNPEEETYPIEVVGVRSEEDYPDRANTLQKTDTPQLDYSEVYEGMEVVWKDNNINEFESGVVEKYNSEIASISRDNKPGNIHIEYALTGENSEYEITHANKFDSLSDSEQRNKVKEEFDSVPNQSSYEDSFVKGRVKEQLIGDSLRPDLIKPAANGLDIIDDDDPTKSRNGVSDGPQDALYVKYNSDGSAVSSTTLHEPTHSFHSSHGYETKIYPHRDFAWDDWNFLPNGAGQGATKNASQYFMRGGFNGAGDPDDKFVGQGNVVERASKEMGMLNADYYRDNPKTPSIKTQKEDGSYVFDVEEGTNLLFEYNGKRFSGQVRKSTTVNGDKSATIELYDYRKSRRQNLFLDQQSGEIKASERFVDAGNEVMSKVVVEYVDNYGKTPDPRDWEPQSDTELEQLFEAVNRAWWKQVFRNSVKDKPGETEWRESFIGSDYSMRSPKETLTRTSEILFARKSVSTDAQPHFASTLEFRFPNLVEAWTNIWKPSVDVNDNWLDGDYR